jgi:hypothetical protein
MPRDERVQAAAISDAIRVALASVKLRALHRRPVDRFGDCRDPLVPSRFGLSIRFLLRPTLGPQWVPTVHRAHGMDRRVFACLALVYAHFRRSESVC